MKVRVPERLAVEERLALAALRNHWQAGLCEEGESEKLVRIGRAQGFTEALDLLLGDEQDAFRLMKEMAQRVAQEDDLVDYVQAVSAEPGVQVSMGKVVRQVEREVAREKERTWGLARVFGMREKGLVRLAARRALRLWACQRS